MAYSKSIPPSGSTPRNDSVHPSSESNKTTADYRGRSISPGRVSCDHFAHAKLGPRETSGTEPLSLHHEVSCSKTPSPIINGKKAAETARYDL